MTNVLTLDENEVSIINKQEFLHTSFGDIFLTSYIKDEKAPILLVVPGLGWYHIGPNRSFIQLAEFCADQNIGTILFDYPGLGDSAGICIQQDINLLSRTFLFVYKHVKQKYRSEIFILGYGFGNILLTMHERELHEHKIIYYLPEFDYQSGLPQPTDSCVSGALLDYGADKAAQNRYLFYKAVYGALHDVTYNPVNYKIVEEMEQLPTSQFKSCIDRKGVLIISDRQKEDEIKYADYWYIQEFAENQFPKDWYRVINFWPRTLERLHLDIVRWLGGQVEDKRDTSYYGETGEVSLKSVQKDTYKELIPFTSADQRLYGVLHDCHQGSKKRPCVVYVPGVGGSKIDSYCCGPRFGEYLASRGIRFFRHDCRNEGTNIKSLSGFNWTDVIEDTVNALEQLSSLIDSERFYYVSWSAGVKTICVLSKIMPEKINGSCLWNPIFTDHPQKRDTYDFVLPKYTKNIRGELVTQAGGEYLGMNYVIDSKKYDFKDMFIHMDSPISVIWGSTDIHGEDYEFISGCSHIEQTEIITTRHHLFSYDIMDEIFEKTYQWIKEKEKIYAES